MQYTLCLDRMPIPNSVQIQILCSKRLILLVYPRISQSPTSGSSVWSLQAALGDMTLSKETKGKSVPRKAGFLAYWILTWNIPLLSRTRKAPGKEKTNMLKMEKRPWKAWSLWWLCLSKELINTEATSFDFILCALIRSWLFKQFWVGCSPKCSNDGKSKMPSTFRMFWELRRQIFTHHLYLISHSLRIFSPYYTKESEDSEKLAMYPISHI